jgi:hypothetical protein
MSGVRTRPKIAVQTCPPAKKAREWFCNALDNDDVKPSLGVCEKFAREIHAILNRRNNEELGASQKMEAEKRKEKLRIAANRFFKSS